MTPRQQQALVWLRSVGPADARLARHSGYAARTMDALVEAGEVERSYPYGDARPVPDR